MLTLMLMPMLMMLDQLFQAITGTGTVIIIHFDADAVIVNLLILMLMVRGQLFQPMIGTGTVLSTC